MKNWSSKAKIFVVAFTGALGLAAVAAPSRVSSGMDTVNRANFYFSRCTRIASSSEDIRVRRCFVSLQQELQQQLYQARGAAIAQYDSDPELDRRLKMIRERVVNSTVGAYLEGVDRCAADPHSSLSAFESIEYCRILTLLRGIDQVSLL